MKQTHNTDTTRIILLTAAMLAVLGLSGCATTGMGHGEGAQPMPVASIIRMSGEGVPAGAIIRKIHDSQTVYRISPAQAVLLEQTGVPARVVRYMKRTYQYAIRRNAALRDRRYWHADVGGYWYGGPFEGPPWPPAVAMPPEGQ